MFDNGCGLEQVVFQALPSIGISTSFGVPLDHSGFLIIVESKMNNVLHSFSTQSQFCAPGGVPSGNDYDVALISAGCSLNEFPRLPWVLSPRPSGTSLGLHWVSLCLLPMIMLKAGTSRFRSSMTLFAAAAPEEPIFKAALEKFFGGQHDPLTIKLLQDSKK